MCEGGRGGEEEMEMGRGVAPKSGGVADRVGEDGVKMDGWMDG